MSNMITNLTLLLQVLTLFLDSKAALSITTIRPPQLMLFWLLSSSRKDKMAAGFEIEYCMIGPASCMVVSVDCCTLGRKSCFRPYNRCRAQSSLISLIRSEKFGLKP